MKKYNFFAGPAVLPQSVIKKAAENVLDFNGSGLSVLEVSHRSKDFVETMEKAISLVKELLSIGDEFEVLFLQGGASSQFYMAPMNLLNEDQTAGYINTGAWSTKAIKEVKAYGGYKLLGSSEETTFDRIPKNLDIPSDLRYVHYTSNNTIYGTQFHETPQTDVKLVCDMSSDIFSRPVDLEKYDLIYAGAQKNMGPAGATLVIVRKSALGKVSRHLPSMINYQTHIDKGSMFNTPPVFPVYVSMLTLEWLKEQGGVAAIQKQNETKAKKLYDEIDRNSMFKGHALNEDRSNMNVSFTSQNAELEAEFIKKCESEGLIGLKGHRSIGGLRASIYNALDPKGIDILVDLMKAFEQAKA